MFFDFRSPTELVSICGAEEMFGQAVPHFP